MIDIKEVVDYLNTFNNYQLSNSSDDGRVNSLTSEDLLVSTIEKNLSHYSNIKVEPKTSNRQEHDFVLSLIDNSGESIFTEGHDIKIVEPSNFTNTVSFVKLSKMLNLDGMSYETVIKSYEKKSKACDIKLTQDYSILFFNKSTMKFFHCYLSEMPNNDVTTNPSNCIQTKLPTELVTRTEEEKFNFIHSLWKGYIYKRVVAPAKLCESIDFSDMF
jgi:hypothetical protein